MGLLGPAASILTPGGLLILIPLFLISCLLGYLVLERSHSLGLEVVDLFPALRRKKSEARGRLREALSAYLRGPTLERRDALRLACGDLRIPLTRFADQVARESLSLDHEIGDLEVREAALLTEIEIGRGHALIAALSRASLLLGLLGALDGLSEMFHVLWFASFRDPLAGTSGLPLALMSALTCLTVSLAGTAAGRLLAARSRRESDEVRAACARARGPSPEVWA